MVAEAEGGVMRDNQPPAVAGQRQEGASLRDLEGPQPGSNLMATSACQNDERLRTYTGSSHGAFPGGPAASHSRLEEFGRQVSLASTDGLDRRDAGSGQGLLIG